MAVTRPQHQGTYEGLATFTHNKTGVESEVNCRIEMFQDFIQYRAGVEVPRKTDLIGQIWPVPSDVQPPFPNGPHTLKIKDERLLKCWVQNDEGAVKCG